MFIDIHSHAYKKIGPKQNGYIHFVTPEELYNRFDEIGIEKGCLLPLVGPEVFLPESNEEVLEMVENSNGRLIPFCNIDPRVISNSADAPLDYLLNYYKDMGCKGLGELMPNLEFMDPRVQNLFKHCEAVGFPVLFDSCIRIGGNYGLVDEVGMPQLELSLQKFPNLIILGHGPAFWAEISTFDTSADRTRYPDYPIRDEGVVPKLMRRYPNLWADLSAGSGYNALSRDPDYAVKFINEFQDKLLFGTDICTADQKLPLAEFLIGLRDSHKITDETFNKIAKGNAVKLLDL